MTHYTNNTENWRRPNHWRFHDQRVEDGTGWQHVSQQDLSLKELRSLNHKF